MAQKNTGYIMDCYSNVNTSAEEKAGAFIGQNIYGILRSYSLGQALASQNQVGGFAGTNIGIIDLCFFDAERSGLLANCDAITKQTAELKQRATYKCWGDGVWVLDPGGNYPRLAWENTPGIAIVDEPRDYGGGSGSEEDPYLIYTPEQLIQIGLYELLCAGIHHNYRSILHYGGWFSGETGISNRYGIFLWFSHDGYPGRLSERGGVYRVCRNIPAIKDCGP
jgi:hypothetical protein